MSRHRDIRNLDFEDHDFDDEDADHYGSSYGGGSSHYGDDSYLSTSIEREFMYRRNQSGTTPKMSHFLENYKRDDSMSEEDGGGGGGGERRLSRQNSYTGEDLSPTDQIRLATCLEKILDIVGEAIPESIIKDAIVKCDYDHELTLNTVLNNPPSKRVNPLNKSNILQDSKEPSKAPTVPTTSRHIPIIETESFKVPSSNAVPLIVTTSKSSSNGGGGVVVRTPNRSRSQTPSPALSKQSSGQTTPNNSSGKGEGISTMTPGSQIKVPMRKTKINVAQEYTKVKSEGGGKDLLNLVVVGHVDSGKSTLMGHLLVSLGNVSSRVMHKYEQESRKVGKQSFCYAWVLDETSEERARGITMDVGQNKFETNNKIITLLDAPGHKDFIPKMISGAYQADVAILVINATKGEFEAGFDAGGQTREHGLLVRSLGVLQLVVAVNKLDTVDWEENRFLEIKKKLDSFLKQIGFKPNDVTYVPCSGFTGHNLKDRYSEKLDSWSIKCPTLLEAIDNFKSPTRLVDKPFRLSVSDVFKPEQTAGFSVSGRIESGFVQKEDRVLICPLNEISIVKSVTSDTASINHGISAFAGDVITVTLAAGTADITNVTPGMVICDPQAPITVSRKFQARIVIFHIDVPITKGFPVVLHYASVQIQATIKKLLAEINKSSGEVKKAKPRCLLKNCNASVEIHTETPICIELYSEIKELGRFMLRSGGKTIAAGLITKIL